MVCQREKRKGVVVSQDITKLERISNGICKQRAKLIEANKRASMSDFNRSYSEDIVIIHTLRTYDELEHVINALVIRLRDFAKLYAPEQAEKAEGLDGLLKLFSGKGDEFGYPVSQEHIAVFAKLGHKLKLLTQQQGVLQGHLETTMKVVCPNILGLAGPLLGARLLSIAGSLKGLAMMPYSTIQLLGAEKALFRHVRKGSKTPKHGIIFAHPIVSSAEKKGRAARLLAERLSRAARLDYFKGANLSRQMLDEIKKKLK